MKGDEATLDLSVINLELCRYMAKAQAQYCAFEKVKRTSPGSFNLLSQLAMQAAAYYKKAHQLILSPSMANAASIKSCISVLNFNACAFTAQAHYWMAQQYLKNMKESNTGIGKAVGHLKKASDSIDSMREEEKGLSPAVYNQYKALSKHYSDRAKNLENKNIANFKEPVPDKLDPIECLQFTQPFSLDEDLARPFEGKDIISRLLPFDIQRLEDDYKNFIEEIISECLQWITISDREQEAILPKHNLPACLYGASGEQRVPEDLLVKIQQCKEKGGIRFLRFALNNLTSSSESVELKINNLTAQLQCQHHAPHKSRRLR